MSLLSSIATVVTSDPYPRALERLKQARAEVTVAESTAGRASRHAEARAKEVEAYPHLNEHRGFPDWSPAQDAGEVGILDAKDAEAAAAVDYDTHEPRVQSLRDRVRQTPKQLANASQNPRIVAIQTHVDALRELGVEVGNPASAEAQKEIGDEFGRIADDLKALRADRQRDNMPPAHLFTAERVEHCKPLRNLGLYAPMLVLEGLRQAAYSNALTVEILDAVCDLLGTLPAPPAWTSTARGYEITQRRKHWEETEQRHAKRVDDRRLGLGY